MSKNIIFTLLCFAFTIFDAKAQEYTDSLSQIATISDENQTATQIVSATDMNQTTAATQQVVIRYGKIHYNDILVNMPEYKAAKEQMAILRKKYEDEANYNESSFKRLFAEFLQEQKDFPQNIMLKRQRDLQDAMEKGIAFRQEADSLLRQAEIDFQKPIRARLDNAIYLVGAQRGYECIFNIDSNSVPFVHPMITEDATPFVLAKLKELKP